MCAHYRGYEMRYYQDSDTGTIFAIGRCYLCCQDYLMACSCGETFMVLKGVFCCPSCDCMGAMVWPPTARNTNGNTCDPIAPQDGSEERGVA